MITHSLLIEMTIQKYTIASDAQNQFISGLPDLLQLIQALKGGNLGIFHVTDDVMSQQ